MGHACAYYQSVIVDPVVARTQLPLAHMNIQFDWVFARRRVSEYKTWNEEQLHYMLLSLPLHMRVPLIMMLAKRRRESSKYSHQFLDLHACQCRCEAFANGIVRARHVLLKI